MDTRKSMFAFLKDTFTDEKAEKIFYYGKRLNAKDFLDHADRVAGFLTSVGIKKGDSVGICLPNIPQAAIVFYAVNKIGAIANVMHPKTGAGSLRDTVVRTDTKALFLFDRFLYKNIGKGESKIPIVYCRLSDYLPSYKKLFRITEPVICKKNIFSYETVLRKNLSAAEVPSDGSEAAVYLHSSGTTGAPKTVVLSSYAFNELAVNVFDTVKDLCEIDERISVLMILPLFHGFGLGICVHLALWKGRMLPLPLFGAKTTVRLMKKEPVNVIPGVPGMFRKLAEEKTFRGDFLKNIKMIFCGGDRLDPEVKRAFEKRLSESGCLTPIMEGYGLSEVASVASINTFDPSNGSLGRPISKVRFRIMSSDGKECQSGESGEIYVSSPSVMNGYLDGVESGFVFSDGETWLPSGDIGYLDEDGCLHYRERIKRIIKIGGVNVFPQEIEEAAAKYPDVKNACAVRIIYAGKPAVKLIVEITEKPSAGFEEGLKNYIGKKLMPYAVPRVIERTEKIRTNALGKADYRYYEEGRDKS